MAKILNDETWRKLLEEFSSYEGTVSSFCKGNDISKSQFYYYKNKFAQSSKPTFHAIVINSCRLSSKIGFSRNFGESY